MTALSYSAIEQHSLNQQIQTDSSHWRSSTNLETAVIALGDRQCTNHNALSEPAELYRLTDKGITAFELAYKESRRRDQYRNEFRYRAKVNGTGTAARYAWDLFLTYW